MTRGKHIKKSLANDTKSKHEVPSILERLAILGDSGMALVGSFALLLVAIFASFNLNESCSASKPTIVDAFPDFELLYQNLGPTPQIDPPHVFSIEDDPIELIREAYRKEGVVAIRGLVPASLLDRLDTESRSIIENQAYKGKPSKIKKQMQFHTMKNGAAFLNPPEWTDSSMENLDNVTAFLEVAVFSRVPALASELMSPELKTGETVRMMRDIFLARSSDQEFACGFHVDDVGFWPATAESPGINAWISLDDMPSKFGGGFSLAVGSHNAAWAREAQFVTGATTFFPKNGYTSAADMFSNRTGSGTCNIQTSAPHLFRRMEETEKIYDLKKGDVIFHQRFMFHRTVPFKIEYATQVEGETLLYRRYSVRYSPGTAIIPPGYGTELSVLWDDRNGNRTADEVCELDAPWYPKVWPSYNIQEVQGLKALVDTKMQLAETRKELRKKEMQPFLQQAARQRGSTKNQR